MLCNTHLKQTGAQNKMNYFFGGLPVDLMTVDILPSGPTGEPKARPRGSHISHTTRRTLILHRAQQPHKGLSTPLHNEHDTHRLRCVSFHSYYVRWLISKLILQRHRVSDSSESNYTTAKKYCTRLHTYGYIQIYTYKRMGERANV